MAAAVAMPCGLAAFAPEEMSTSFDFKTPAGVGGAALEAKLADSDAALAQWRKDRLHALRHGVQRAAYELGRERAALEELQAEVRSDALIEDFQQARADGARARGAVREAAAASAKRSAVAATARDRFLEVERQRLAEVRREERHLEEQEAAAAARRAELETLLGLYRGRLGLDVARVAEQTVRLTFTLLDADRPEREFACTLGDGHGDGYRVSDCEPALPAGRLAALARQLNHGGEAEGQQASALPAFVCGLRRAFKEVASFSAA